MGTRSVKIDAHRLLMARTLQGGLLDQLREVGLPISYSVAEGLFAEPELKVRMRIKRALAEIGATGFRENRDPNGDRTFLWEVK